MKSKLSVDNEMPFKIRKLIETGHYAVDPEENITDFNDIFYEWYEQIVSRAMIGFVPLEFNAATQSFGFLPKFLETADVDEFALWKENVLAVCDTAEATDEEIDAILDGLENEDDDQEIDFSFPDLDYRINAEDYAVLLFEEMTGVPLKRRETIFDEMDGYGLIENRTEKLFLLVEEICDEYALPRLPLMCFSTQNKMPRFLATKHEVKNFSELLARRSAMTKEELSAVKKDFEKQKDSTTIFYKGDEKSYLFPSAIDHYVREGKLTVSDSRPLPEEKLVMPAPSIGWQISLNKGLDLN